MSYCPNCGKLVKEEQRFCDQCGTFLKEPVKVRKEELKLEKPLVIEQVPTPSKKPSIVMQVFGLLIFLGFLYFLYITAGCAIGTREPGQDVMCRNLYQAFHGGGGSEGGGAGGTGGGTQILRRGGCPVGSCWSNGHCCPSNARYYCNGGCFPTEELARAVDYRCTLSYKIICD